MIRTNKNGFTLIEVIMSIAILSIASVIVLQLFVVTSNLNTHSVNIDMAGIKASNAIESIKGYSLKEVEALDSQIVSNYNEDWMQTEGESEFQLVLSLEEDVTYDDLYKIQTFVFEKDRETPLIVYETKYYFHIKE